MSRLSISLSCAMSLMAMAGSSLGNTAQQGPEPQHKLAAASAPAANYQRAIAELESTGGAYAPQLSESLLSLGTDLQRKARHAEAIRAFKRGAHLARINEGLYCAQQIPMLQREISSHLALGQYAEADERQAYLYRVQMRSMERSLPRAQALMQQAQWQYTAYNLDPEGQGYTRLMNMSNLYHLALTDIIEDDGESSTLLLEPLQGMLLAQYLIADYTLQDGNGSGNGISVQQQVNQFSVYRAQSYKRGRAIIQMIYDIQKAHHGHHSLETARSLTMLGDWMLWHGKSESAMKAYRQATAELTPRDDAERIMAGLFDQPVELPDLEGAGYLPAQADASSGNLRLQFGVDTRGRVIDLERVDNNELNSVAANHIMRTLRKTRFRPRMAMGEPQGTERVTRTYAVQ